mmetsp:Transcript_1482/g.3075  ORF Transcript_1482/g.3075 Transcript_1482/m.3075 type:complete len:269 (-) Transcript_1482:356-1162(-)
MPACVHAHARRHKGTLAANACTRAQVHERACTCQGAGSRCGLVPKYSSKEKGEEEGGEEGDGGGEEQEGSRAGGRQALERTRRGTFCSLVKSESSMSTACRTSVSSSGSALFTLCLRSFRPKESERLTKDIFFSPLSVLLPSASTAPWPASERSALGACRRLNESLRTSPETTLPLPVELSSSVAAECVLSRGADDASGATGTVNCDGSTVAYSLSIGLALRRISSSSSSSVGSSVRGVSSLASFPTSALPVARELPSLSLESHAVAC